MKAKKGKTLLQLFVFTMICVLVLTGITIQSAAVKSSELAREQLGGSVTLKVDREKMMKEQQDSGDRKSLNRPPFLSNQPRNLRAFTMSKAITSSPQHLL